MEGKDKPRKENDHACDALRYAVMHIDDGNGTLEVRLLGGGKSSPMGPQDARAGAAG